jgi:hypothetical protein
MDRKKLTVKKENICIEPKREEKVRKNEGGESRRGDL